MNRLKGNLTESHQRIKARGEEIPHALQFLIKMRHAMLVNTHSERKRREPPIGTSTRKSRQKENPRGKTNKIPTKRESKRENQQNPGRKRTQQIKAHGITSHITGLDRRRRGMLGWLAIQNIVR